ncbi:MAG: TetR/AcrR family transcriptional regulator [Sphingomonadaceae bacterium]|nr:TetR/AcrR family transcriptional regulator [Sphingomonadaceae bacterium]
MSRPTSKLDNRKQAGSRRTQAERSEEMRARLKQAAFDLVASGGLGALRIANVAKTAGVSQGAVLHHFPNKNQVTLAAVERALELANSESVAWDTVADDPDRVLRAMIDEFRRFFFSDRFWVAIAINVEHSSEQGFSELMTNKVAAMRQPVYAAWQEKLVQAGWKNTIAEKLVRSGAALISGIAVRRMWAEPDQLSDEIITDWISAAQAMRK